MLKIRTIPFYTLSIIFAVLTIFISCQKEELADIKKGDIVVTEPKNGSELEKGKSYNIIWNTDKAEQLRIDLYKGDNPVRLISASETNTGNYQWLVPHDIEPDSNYRIRIRGNDKNISAFSYFFSISGDSVKKYVYISEFYFNNWMKGGDSLITWTDNIKEDIRIDLLLNDSYHSTIVESTPSNGSYNWKIPSGLPTSSRYSLKIISTLYSDLYDVTDYFRISETNEINLLKNGNFATENDWYFSNPATDTKNRWNINKVNKIGAAEVVSMQSDGSIMQDVPGIIPGQKYIVNYTLSRCNGYFGGARLNATDSSRAHIKCFIGMNYGSKKYNEGTFSDTIVASGNTIGFSIVQDPGSYPNNGFICKLDNVELFPE